MNSLTKKNIFTQRSRSPLPMTMKLLFQRGENKGLKSATNLEMLKRKIRSISMLRNQGTDRVKAQDIVKRSKEITKSISPHPLTFTQFRKTVKTPFQSRNKRNVSAKRDITQTNSTCYKTTENILTKSQLKSNREDSTPKIEPFPFNHISLQIESIEEYHFNIVKAIQKENKKVLHFKQLFEKEEEISYHCGRRSIPAILS